MDVAKKAVDSVAEGVKNVAINDKKGGKKEKKPKTGGNESAGPLEMKPAPDFLQHRLDLFDRLKKEQDEELAKKPREPITITMPDGSVKAGTAYETTPGDIAKGISNSLYKRTVVARLDNDKEQLWDLDRPLEKSCKLELLDFEDEQGKFVFWHSSAHILGEASERRFGCSLCIGPPVSDGFYYEMALPEGAAVQASDWKPLETIVSSIVKEKQKFERLVLSKEHLLEMFNYNKYKQHIIKDKIADGTFTTVYRNGPLIDLCRGPHVPDTGRIEAFAIMKNSASYFLGDNKNDSLQRIYGVSFPDKKQMAAHKKFLEEAAKRDHRKIGKDQELFFFSDMSPGSAMWLPHGTRIYNTLLEYIREQYWKRGYQEVITPNMYNSELWKVSGHWNFYKDDMFVIDMEEDLKFGLKPMNCPGHCLLFGHRERSHRELPWRVADFGVLHRNEASGALSGLTRVRRFQQDDAHIFCREDQIKGEMADLFDFLHEMYGLLGMTFKLKLSTRPEKFMGEIETWDRAEGMLKESLDAFAAAEGGVPWTLNPGDGAFYGPKIDITLVDCLSREWQCATIQLDFLQPQNFGLEYMTADNSANAKAKEEEPEKAEKSAAGPPRIKVKNPQAIIDSATAAKEGVPNPATSKDQASGAKEAPKRAIKPLSQGCARPVMIHRAMAGSIERFTGILCEHFAGKWPFWLSPRQILIIPVGVGFYPYAEEVQGVFKKAKMFVDVDLSGNTLQKKVRTGQLAQYNFIFVVGDEEVKGRQVNVRWRDDTNAQDRGKPITLDEAVEKLTKLKEDRGTYNPFPSIVKPAKEGEEAK
ncbi:threonyl-tRNA synthetase [Pseudomassariella vexata]|uniref:threonine--tRNA ligase n=1 Tax=Pseudomassariella vexata TaxID=1141098 RepID=A0A1Y2E747_9PEZI|nr:threonyl-tRNA synthetase [Pseudomassariella vexata]ORY67096.1 threonyl-tRNA synthetase [Pseudomassariella vexata]